MSCFSDEKDLCTGPYCFQAETACVFALSHNVLFTSWEEKEELEKADARQECTQPFCTACLKVPKILIIKPVVR